MLRRLLILVVLTLGLPSSAYQLRRDSGGTVVRWKGHVEFVLDPSVAIQLKAPKTEAAARAALATLAEVAPDVELSLRVGETHGVGYDLEEPGRNLNGVMVLSDWPYSDGALAATVVTVNAKTHEIVDADVAFNAEGNVFGVVDPSGPSDGRLVNDIQNTLTHEFGHALGLLHNADNARVVMYPSAPPGEVSKRVLAEDDREALSVLYAERPAAAQTGVAPDATGPVSAGCSSAGGRSLFAAAAWALLLAASRRRRATFAPATVGSVVLLAAAPSAWAAPRLDFTKSETVAVGSVVKTTSEKQGSLFVTRLEIQVNSCAKGPCPSTVVVTVPGGRVGDYEQVVVDHPVPKVGEALAVSITFGRHHLHRLEIPAEAAAFTEALRGLVSVSRPPQSVPVAPATVAQPPVKTP